MLYMWSLEQHLSNFFERYNQIYNYNKKKKIINFKIEKNSQSIVFNLTDDDIRNNSPFIYFIIYIKYTDIPTHYSRKNLIQISNLLKLKESLTGIIDKMQRNSEYVKHFNEKKIRVFIEDFSEYRSEIIAYLILEDANILYNIYNWIPNVSFFQVKSTKLNLEQIIVRNCILIISNINYLTYIYSYINNESSQLQTLIENKYDNMNYYYFDQKNIADFILFYKLLKKIYTNFLILDNRSRSGQMEKNLATLTRVISSIKASGLEQTFPLSLSQNASVINPQEKENEETRRIRNNESKGLHPKRLL